MKIRIIALLFVFALVMTGCSKGGERLVQRDSPEKEVSAEEFKKEYGFCLSVPKGAEDVIYVIDTETLRGTMSFKLNDSYWSARVLKTNTFIDEHYYVDETMEEIDSIFADNQDIKVCGVEPEVKSYRVHYADNSGAYKSTATWFLKDKGLWISLDSYSEKRPDTMPVEVFDKI